MCACIYKLSVFIVRFVDVKTDFATPQFFYVSQSLALTLRVLGKHQLWLIMYSDFNVSRGNSWQIKSSNRFPTNGKTNIK